MCYTVAFAMKQPSPFLWSSSSRWRRGQPEEGKTRHNDQARHFFFISCCLWLLCARCLLLYTMSTIIIKIYSFVFIYLFPKLHCTSPATYGYYDNHTGSLWIVVRTSENTNEITVNKKLLLIVGINLSSSPIITTVKK